ncbi:MAG: M1 family metallopeptidase [Bacteroidota bacterium]|nr:M1 family metallopeptidase [Bacteroidota bacterium]
MRKIILFLFLMLSIFQFAFSQGKKIFTHADTLRGSITPQRAWWDVTFYDLHVKINPSDSSISGYNGITYRVIEQMPSDKSLSQEPGEMQIDLMTPLVVDSMIQNGQSLKYRRDGNAFFVKLTAPQPLQSLQTITVYYQGKPRVAKNPPWDGGFIWKKDSLGNALIATACQGVGASIWWPNKDIQADEPDSQRIAITVPDTLVNVSNGTLRKRTLNPDGTMTYEWFVSNPINNYDVAVNTAKYVHFNDIYNGEKGPLTLDYYVLPYHLEQAEKQFTQVKSMLKCFEYWFGPYPWYEDGYKLVEAPHLGMEHQSCIAYGNHFGNGYLGRDMSGAGWGLKWDFIIVHESAHEWFGNNITTKDLADMWVHESFANYSESLYTECLFGKEAGAQYARGVRHIKNDRPVVGQYGVNDEGSGDMYNKGGNMLHTIRQIVNNDEKWREILRGLNKTFWHQTVTGQQIENYISTKSGIDLSKVFEQYLTTITIPEFDYYIKGNKLHYRWSHVVPGFNMPLKAILKGKVYSFIYPATQWKTITLGADTLANFVVDNNFYVTVKNTGK